MEEWALKGMNPGDSCEEFKLKQNQEILGTWKCKKKERVQMGSAVFSAWWIMF